MHGLALLVRDPAEGVGAERLYQGAPDLDQAISGVTFTSQAVTPLTDKTSRYFFSWGRKHSSKPVFSAMT
jgi:hypothetical protein